MDIVSPSAQLLLLFIFLDCYFSIHTCQYMVHDWMGPKRVQLKITPINDTQSKELMYKFQMNTTKCKDN